jgi:hypothetical protein
MNSHGFLPEAQMPPSEAAIVQSSSGQDIILLRQADIYERVIHFVGYPTDIRRQSQYFPVRSQQTFWLHGLTPASNSIQMRAVAAPGLLYAEA